MARKDETPLERLRRHAEEYASTVCARRTDDLTNMINGLEPNIIFLVGCAMLIEELRAQTDCLTKKLQSIENAVYRASRSGSDLP